MAVEELQKIHRKYAGMKPSTGTYSEFLWKFSSVVDFHISLINTDGAHYDISAFSDGTQKDLLKLNGVLPVNYEGKSDMVSYRKGLIMSWPTLS